MGAKGIVLSISKQEIEGSESNHQDFVFICPPGMARGVFDLRMDNVWYCKLLLFEIESRTHDGIKRHKCAFVSVVEDLTGDKKPGIIFTSVIYAIYSTYVTYIE